MNRYRVFVQVEFAVFVEAENPDEANEKGEKEVEQFLPTTGDWTINDSFATWGWTCP